MTKEEFMKKIERLIEVRTKVCVQHIYCSDCEFDGRCHDICCLGDLWDYAEKNKRTRQSEFLKQFPNARIKNETDDCLTICPNYLDTTFMCRNGSISCMDCLKEYWLEETEDGKKEWGHLNGDGKR